MRELYDLAESHGIKIERCPLNPVLDAVYIKEETCHPVIAISSTIAEDTPQYRTVLAHELGHHFTTAGSDFPRQMYSYASRVNVGRSEYRANKWAANYLIPTDSLAAAIESGVGTTWELAEMFQVTEEMMMFRLTMASKVYKPRSLKRALKSLHSTRPSKGE